MAPCRGSMGVTLAHTQLHGSLTHGRTPWRVGLGRIPRGVWSGLGGAGGGAFQDAQGAVHADFGELP
jgi:hypothetical protein